MENVEITVPLYYFERVLKINVKTLLKMKGLNISHVLLPQILTTPSYYFGPLTPLFKFFIIWLLTRFLMSLCM